MTFDSDAYLAGLAGHRADTRTLAAALVELADEEGRFSLSVRTMQSTLADQAGLSKRQIATAWTALKSAGLVSMQSESVRELLRPRSWALTPAFPVAVRKVEPLLRPLSTVPHYAVGAAGVLVRVDDEHEAA